mgnify:CR=1 FL=1
MILYFSSGSAALLIIPMLALCSVRTMSCSSFFFLMIRRPPRSTLDRSSAASDVYKRQGRCGAMNRWASVAFQSSSPRPTCRFRPTPRCAAPVSYTHLRAHETVLDLVCRLLLEKTHLLTNQPHTMSIVPNYTDSTVTLS